jgi:hypothetical protein
MGEWSESRETDTARRAFYEAFLAGIRFTGAGLPTLPAFQQVAESHEVHKAAWPRSFAMSAHNSLRRSLSSGVMGAPLWVLRKR